MKSKKKHVSHAAKQISLPVTDWAIAEHVQEKLELPFISNVFHQALIQYAKLVDRRRK